MENECVSICVLSQTALIMFHSEIAGVMKMPERARVLKKRTDLNISLYPVGVKKN